MTSSIHQTRQITLLYFYIRDRLQLPFTKYAQYTSDMILQKNMFYQLTLFFM